MAENGIGVHSLELHDRRVMRVTGVNDVDSFDENQIKLFTESGELLVCGEQLHVNEMSVGSGSLTIEGSISAVVYGDSSVRKKLGLLGRLFR